MTVGEVVGFSVGIAVGKVVGLALGFCVGFTVGLADGCCVGCAEGCCVGAGVDVGAKDGEGVSCLVGIGDGGCSVSSSNSAYSSNAVGMVVGLLEGLEVGSRVI